MAAEKELGSDPQDLIWVMPAEGFGEEVRVVLGFRRFGVKALNFFRLERR